MSHACICTDICIYLRSMTFKTFIRTVCFASQFSHRNDPIMVRNKLTQDLLKAVGGLAPRIEYGRLSVNGVFFGLYTIEESLGERELSLVVPTAPRFPVHAQRDSQNFARLNRGMTISPTNLNCRLVQVLRAGPEHQPVRPTPSSALGGSKINAAQKRPRWVEHLVRFWLF